jgi:hypothetical protein
MDGAQGKRQLEPREMLRSNARRQKSALKRVMGVVLGVNRNSCKPALSQGSSNDGPGGRLQTAV